MGSQWLMLQQTAATCIKIFIQQTHDQLIATN